MQVTARSWKVVRSGLMLFKAEYSNLHFIREASGTANFLTVDMEHLFITWRGLD